MALNCVSATLRMVRIGRWKLNLVAKSIRGLPALEALAQLTSMRKRAAKDVAKLLYSAMSNAENNNGLSSSTLYVAEASVGKNMVMKRLDIKGRSRSGRITKEFSQMRIVLMQMQEKE